MAYLSRFCANDHLFRDGMRGIIHIRHSALAKRKLNFKHSCFSVWRERFVLECIFHKELDKAKKFCFDNGVFLDGIISEINEKACDVFGDVLIDADAKEIFCDYWDEVLAYLNKE